MLQNPWQLIEIDASPGFNSFRHTISAAAYDISGRAYCAGFFLNLTFTLIENSQ